MSPVQTISIGAAKFDVTDTQKSFWDRVASGHWEPATYEAIGRNLTPDTVFLDFGAWIGPVTLFAANHVAKVISFEPDPEAANQLRANIALNPELASKITLLERAVWSEPGKLRLGAKKAKGDSMSSVHHTGSGDHWEVEAITPAEIAAMLPDDAPLFIKIDTEGAEYAIVPVLAPLLARKNVTALVSFHPRFAGGNHPRWHKTIPMTKRVLDVFKGWRIDRVHHGSIHRAPVIEALNRLGLAYIEAKTTYLFTRG